MGNNIPDILPLYSIAEKDQIMVAVWLEFCQRPAGELSQLGTPESRNLTP